MTAVEPPPEHLKGYWCPTCGRFELTRQAWHVRSGSIGDRCEQTEMTPCWYEAIPTPVGWS
jgi:hypothetical protein